MKLLSSIAWCLSLCWRASKWYTITRVAVGVLTPLFAILGAFIGKHVIDLLAGQSAFNREPRVLMFLLLGLLAVALVRMLVQRAEQYCQAMHEDILSGRLSLIIMERALQADLEYFDNPAYHDKLTAANSDSYGIIYIIWNVMSSISAAISFLGVFLVLWQVSVFYGVFMLAASLPSSIIAARYTKLLYMLTLEQINGQRQMSYVQSIATDRLHAQDLRLFNAGVKLKDKYRRLWDALFANRRTAMRKRALLTGLLECLPEAVVAWIGIDIALRVLAGTATVGDYSLYIGLAAQLWGAISMLSSSVINIYDNQMKIENFEAIETFKNHVLDEGAIELKQVDTIAFEGVYFTYPGTQYQALRDVSFALHKAEKLALVGLNGSGKSTVIKLLLRMYMPDCGVIRINGIDIQEYTMASLRANFSCYFQDMRNYSFTLEENFTIADDGRGDFEAEAKSSLLSADCGDILGRAEKAGKGLNASLTRFFEPDGIELSGGQHQKLALARALFRRHTALILDEPSSNLDPKAEHTIFEALSALTEGKMAIFTSHRLSNVFLADRIIVLEKGTVIEDGTQEELLNNPKRYAELYRYQQEKYTISLLPPEAE